MRSEMPMSNGGIGITGMLGLMFVGLKLAGVIQWSWWWVTLPFWSGPAVIAIVAMALLIETYRNKLDVLRHK